MPTHWENVNTEVPYQVRAAAIRTGCPWAVGGKATAELCDLLLPASLPAEPNA